MKNKPWLSEEAINFIDSKLTKASTMFEYGAGGSTVYYSDRVRKIYSVENDKNWYEKIISYLKNNNIKNVEIRHINFDPGSSDRILDFNSYASNSLYYNHKIFKTYAKAVNVVKDNSLDLILVDGRARISCVHEAYCKLKSGGVLVLDDTERSYYKPAIEFIDSLKWKKIHLKGKTNANRTTIWVKS